MAATKTTLHVAGWRDCQYFQKAATVVCSMQHMFPNTLVADIIEYPNRDAFREFLAAEASKYGPRAEKHTSSPFTWKGENEFVGGCDDTRA